MPFLALLTWLFFCFGGVSPPVVHPVVLRSCTFSLVTKSLSSSLLPLVLTTLQNSTRTFVREWVCLLFSFLLVWLACLLLGSNLGRHLSMQRTALLLFWQCATACLS